MLDPDISAHDARAHLHVIERLDRATLDRRRFLQLIGMGVGAGMLSTTGAPFADLLGYDPVAWADGPVGPTDGILVVVCMFGGNDGLNMVVPVDDGLYYDQHGPLAIPPSQVLPLSGATGLHPHLTEVKRLWDAGHVAIVEGVGYPNSDLSHFASMANWMTARPGHVAETGWLGRWLDGQVGGADNLYAAAEIGVSLPRHLVGARRRGTVVPVERPDFGTGLTPADLRFYQSMRAFRGTGPGALHAAVTGSFNDHLDVAATLVNHYASPARAGELPSRLEVAARLINANLGFRVLTSSWGDFDSHADQPNMHPIRMTELNDGIKAFFEVLDPAWASRVTVATFSEFGRTSWSNAGLGTDHGSAAPQFVIGQNVRGGIYGERPSLRGLGRWDRMAHHVDFRSFYASLLDGWMGGGSSDVLGADYADLGLFARGPGLRPDGTIVPVPVPVPVPVAGSSASSLVPLVPLRVLDTRSGIGVGTARPLAAGESVRVPVSGVGTVPADGVVAVVANVTIVDATEPNFFTVHPSATSRPGTSNINGGPGRPVPNLVVMGLGTDGAIQVFNSHGDAHCLVDIFGYFSSTTGDRFTSLPPSRLFDTRAGSGIRSGKLGEASPVDVQVAGFAGVPGSGATAVVMNLTATEPESPGFLRVTPTGQPPALTSNVNYFTGDVVPNLVVCKLGDGGRLTIDSVGPGVHVIGDVFGYFSSDGQQLRTVAPSRVLDTREGNGAPRAAVGPGTSIQLSITGRATVPAGASAVVLNVTATNVAGPTYVTVWPSGDAQPGTSNLNVVAGQTVANLVMCRLGPDGAIHLASPISNCDLIADVMGYFER